MADKITIFWFRSDLRLSDNPGLFHAAKNGTVMPIYILDEETEGVVKMGEASRWWLHHSLMSLNKSLEGKLNFFKGSSETVFLKLIENKNIDAVYWNRCYEPWRLKNDLKIAETLKRHSIECQSFKGSLLWEPWEVLKKDQTPYKIFTPFFHNGCLQTVSPRKPFPQPEQLILRKEETISCSLQDFQLPPDHQWPEKLGNHWKIGEVVAQDKLVEFHEHKLNSYKKNRDYPAKPNISRLSPHLHFGEISPHQVWHSIQAQKIQHPWGVDIDCFLSELGWREFSYYLLYHFPSLPQKNFQSKFDQFPWQENDFYLKSWQKGQTGYPIIDAGMRELWQTGFMHNRVRMIVASFLTKNLLIHWRQGEKWFWDCLVDADLANNSASWQWVAGSGVDAAPYFRIFNPVTQSETFDSEGLYIKQFVPELRKLPLKFLFKPWEAPLNVLKEAGVILGKTYPNPIVDLKTSRNLALQAYKMISNE